MIIKKLITKTEECPYANKDYTAQVQKCLVTACTYSFSGKCRYIDIAKIFK